MPLPLHSPEISMPILTFKTSINIEELAEEWNNSTKEVLSIIAHNLEVQLGDILMDSNSATVEDLELDGEPFNPLDYQGELEGEEDEEDDEEDE